MQCECIIIYPLYTKKIKKTIGKIIKFLSKLNLDSISINHNIQKYPSLILLFALNIVETAIMQ